MRKSSVTSRSSFPSGASSCQTTSFGFLRAGLAQVLAHARRAMVPSRCLRKYSWPLPEEPSRLERHTNMLRGQLLGIVRVLAGQLAARRISAPWRHSPSPPCPMAAAFLATVERVGLELRRRRQPAHALGAHVVVDQRAVPRAGRRGRRDDLVDVERLVAPLVGVRVEERGRVLLARRPAPVERRTRAAASPTAGAASPGRRNATSRRPTGRRSRTSPAC